MYLCKSNINTIIFLFSVHAAMQQHASFLMEQFVIVNCVVEIVHLQKQALNAGEQVKMNVNFQNTVRVHQQM